MYTIRIGTREARNQFADLLGRVHYKGEAVIVERSGKPMVAVIPVEMFERLLAEREARFGVIDSIRERAPDVTENDVLEDVAEALAAIRANTSD